jgi:hypothetical protein
MRSEPVVSKLTVVNVTLQKLESKLITGTHKMGQGMNKYR